MKASALFALLLLIPSVYALDPWTVNTLEATVTFSGEVVVTPKAADSKLNWVEASLYILPQETLFQSYELKTVQPEDYSLETDEWGNRYIKFRWNRPGFRDLEYKVEFDVTVNRFTKAITDVDMATSEGFDTYLEPLNLSAWTGAMKTKAGLLTKDSENTFDKVSSLAAWVYRYLKYDTDCWHASIPAREVFLQQKGVCDEFTHLFMSLAKSLGIPARYVEGLVFSGKEWDLHAWSEVYINGWVPVDATYNEVGFIDSTHIALAKTPSDAYISNQLQWEGKDVSVGFGEEDKQIKVKNTTNDINLLSIYITTEEGNTALNQIVPVVVEVKNLANSYIAPTCRLTVPKEMAILADAEKRFFLPPHESSTGVWNVLVKSDLDKKWLYKMPVHVSCFPRGGWNETIVVNPKNTVVKIANLTVSDVTVLSKNKMLAEFMNIGSMKVTNITSEICFDGVCTNKSVGTILAGEKKKLLIDDIPLPEDADVSVSLHSSTLRSATGAKASTAGVSDDLHISPDNGVKKSNDSDFVVDKLFDYGTESENPDILLISLAVAGAIVLIVLMKNAL